MNRWRKFIPKGKKIKIGDTSLLIHLVSKILIGSWMMIMFIFHLPFLIKQGMIKNFKIKDIVWMIKDSIANIQNLNLSKEHNKLINHLTSTYTKITIFLSILLVILVIYLLYKYKYDYYKSITHRQKIARMIMENGWIEIKEIEKSSLCLEQILGIKGKDKNSGKTKKQIIFPKLYYQMKQGLIHITVEITLGKYQDQLLNLEKKLESGLYCELISKELLDGYIKYTLLYDTIANRIRIDEVTIQQGELKLMNNLYWQYDKLPHMLIAGGTGSGKSYFILTLIQSLLKINAKLYILDPKNSDLADLKQVLKDVYSKQEQMIETLNIFYEEMMKRNEEMKTMSNYKTGENYAYLGLRPHFLIFDEYVAFMEMLNTKESAQVLSKLKQIVMLGRQSGFFLILACQRPDAKYLGDGIRDQFNFRVALGRMSEMGYTMMFGETNKQFYLKQIKGRGYVDNGNSVISEFYTPKVPKGYDFLQEIRKIQQSMKQDISKDIKQELQIATQTNIQADIQTTIYESPTTIPLTESKDENYQNKRENSYSDSS